MTMKSYITLTGNFMKDPRVKKILLRGLAVSGILAGISGAIGGGINARIKNSAREYAAFADYLKTVR